MPPGVLTFQDAFEDLLALSSGQPLPDIRTKVEKINAYSSGMVADKAAQGYAFVRTRMLLQPPLQFLRSYLVNRKFLSGWAGFIGSVTEAYYVFLKYAKLYESRQQRRDD